jgi:methylphosphotriester-DNA--protein-cysteine methyltransferase
MADSFVETLGRAGKRLLRACVWRRYEVKELLNEARGSLARNYVDEGSLSVTEIAFVLGFADNQHVLASVQALDWYVSARVRRPTPSGALKRFA